MMKICLWLTASVVLILVCMAAPGWGATPRIAQQANQPKAENVAPAEPRLPPPPDRYELSPQKRAEAIAYSHIRYALYFAGVALALLIYFVLWRGGVAVAFRNWARRLSRRHFLQCLVFAPLFFVTVELVEFPFDFYSDYIVEHRFGLSSEGLGSWAADWGKSLVLLVIVGTFIVWIFYAIVRRSPRRWWFYFWAATIPIILFLMFIEPYVVEPLFFKFTPLQASDPALVAQIEKMLHRAHLRIPPSRILEMNASSKTKTLNAYVSGLGESKRVVVWDTTLKKLTDDETLLVLGHETGHYVLHHILKEFVLDELISLGFIALGFVAVKRLIRRFGDRTGIEGEGDLASFPLMLLVLTALSFFASPAVNAVSRHYEHQADQFALEVTHDVVPDPNAAEAWAFQILGEQDLSDPDPNPFIVFWLYSHPPIDQRIRFAMSYHPWTEGKPMQFVHPGEP
ncbi:MAG: M48 family metallopeptidase [Acidobacteria bacterium]|nr:M48 family metallopeptidase [Acidobacteriota bacterium]